MTSSQLETDAIKRILHSADIYRWQTTAQGMNAARLELAHAIRAELNSLMEECALIADDMDHGDGEIARTIRAKKV